MKARPRRVENQVADYLSAFFVEHGHDPVERIPVLGRTGPDITYNSVGLVVDVKSRKSVPKMIAVPAQEVWLTECYFISRLSEIDNLASLMKHNYCSLGQVICMPQVSSVMVDRWWIHMNEWRKDNLPNGITALVLHRTGEKIANATVVILAEQIWRFCERTNATE